LRSFVPGIALALLLAGPDPRAQEKDGREAVARLQKKIEALTGDDVRRQIDPAALAASLGHAPDKLFLYARALPFQPYGGALRGATGALLSGAANDVDRCLLLAELLRSAPEKPEVRFAFGEISEAQSLALASRALTPSAERPAIGMPIDVVLAKIGETKESLAAAEKAALTSAAPRVKKMAASLGADRAGLEQALKSAGIALSGTPEDGLAARATSLRSHVWLQVRRGEKWVDLDPSFPEAEAGWAPVAASRSVATLPTELDHSVGVKIVIERLNGNELATETVYVGRRPARELAGRAVNVSVMPTGFDVDKMSQPLEAMAPRFQKFQAVVDWGSGTENAKVFDGQGRVFASKDGKFGDDFGGAAGDRLAGAFGRKPGALTAVRIELDSAAPGVAPQVESRFMLDRLKPGTRGGGTPELDAAWKDDVRFRLGLFQSWTLWPAVGTVNDAFLFDRLARMLAAKGGLPAVIFEPADAGRIKAADLAERLDPLPLGLLQLWQTALHLSQGAFGKGGGSCFPERASLFVWKESVVPGEKGGIRWRGGVDVLAAPLGCVAKAPADAARARFLYGLLVSEGESAMMEKGGAPVFSAAAVFRKTREAKGEILVLKGGLGVALLDAATARRVGEELKAGRVVVIPKDPVEIGGRKATAWWRVDPSTGTCLGIGDTGEGQAVSEGVLVLEKISIPMVKRCMKFVICLNSAVIGGRSMQDAGRTCMTEFVKDHLKETIEGAIDHFITSPIKKNVSATAEGSVKDMVDSPLVESLYEKAKEAYGVTSDTIDGFAGQMLMLLSFGHDIASYAAERGQERR